jgi:formylglycine-generating enzyme required for sulfatase activity
MGSPLTEELRDREERQHEVFISRPFWMKETEVTQREWFDVMRTSPSYKPIQECADCPVERVSWFEALTFLNKLSERDGLPACYDTSQCSGPAGDGCAEFMNGGSQCVGNHFCTRQQWRTRECRGWRLPTEAEWEYAARSGRQRGRPSALAERAHADKRSPQPVGMLKPNRWGLYDMLGNVRELVWDCVAPYNYRVELSLDPIGKASQGCERVVRGGGWEDGPAMLRSSARAAQPPRQRRYDVGLRPVRSITVGDY